MSAEQFLVVLISFWLIIIVWVAYERSMAWKYKPVFKLKDSDERYPVYTDESMDTLNWCAYKVLKTTKLSKETLLAAVRTAYGCPISDMDHFIASTFKVRDGDVRDVTALCVNYGKSIELADS